MKKTSYILTFLTLLLGGWAAVLWLLPFARYQGNLPETRYGVNEGLELVEIGGEKQAKRYVVEDAEGNQLFVIPLRNCLLDTRYRNGKLRFREQGSHREGYIDRQGMVTFLGNAPASIPENQEKALTSKVSLPEEATSSSSTSQGTSPQQPQGHNPSSRRYLSTIDLRKMAKSNPFYQEAAKVMQGKLTESDAQRRHTILNYCEHFRTAYTTKDIDFLRQVFSDQALIIVGHVVKPTAHNDKLQAESKVTYAIHSKRNYIARLSKVFAANKQVDVKFSNFRILRHPTMDGIYGVTLRQRYKSDRYSDDGYLFLLWDFRDPSMPLIHVRTWQPASTIHDSNEIINIRDFNLE